MGFIDRECLMALALQLGNSDLGDTWKRCLNSISSRRTNRPGVRAQSLAAIGIIILPITNPSEGCPLPEQSARLELNRC
jgi:hypothetical protein